jgi:hypothetical protein
VLNENTVNEDSDAGAVLFVLVQQRELSGAKNKLRFVRQDPNDARVSSYVAVVYAGRLFGVRELAVTGAHAAPWIV